jgi:hypothetical protein
MTPAQPIEPKHRPGLPNGTAPGRPVPPDEISPKAVVNQFFQLRSVVRRNWKLVLLLVLGGAMIGFVYDLFNKKRPLYTAGMLFNLGGGGGGNNFGELGALAGAFGFGSAAPDANIFVGDNFVIYAKSRPVLEKTLMKTVKIKNRDTLLVNYYIKHSGIRLSDWEDDDTLRGFSFAYAKLPKDYTKLEINAMAGIIARIQANMAVLQPERKSSFIQMKTAMEDEELAKVFIETHLATIEEDYRQKNTKKSREMLELLESRADSLYRVLTGTENRLTTYQDQNQQIVVASGIMQQQKLMKNANFLQTLYFGALQNVENMRLSLIREAPLLTLIEPVALPLYREVKSTIGLQIGLIIGIFLSFVIVFLRETYRSVMSE